MDIQLDFSEDLIVYVDKNSKILELNEPFLALLDMDEKNIIGKKEQEIFKVFSTSKKNENLSNEIFEEIIDFTSQRKYFRTKIEQQSNEKFKITRRDVTEYKQYFSLYNSHIYLLELIAKGKPLEYILNEIIKSVEDKNSNMICSILLYDKSDKKLYKGAAPSLPDYYNDKLNGMLIGEKVGSCGAAAFLKKRFIVEDISTHENWKYAKNLASKFNLKACWSQPIFSSSNETLGTFAIYYNQPKKPTKFDIDLIEDVANITGVAIDKELQNEKLKRKREENKKQEQLLAHSSKQAMMGEMLESIAHQWRQPLSVISLYATGILYKKDAGADTSELDKEAFNVIATNAQYLSDTITNFREYFTSNSQKVRFTLNEAIKYSLTLFEGRMKAEEIKIIHTLEDIELYNYRNELTQVFINLFNNSADILKTMDSQNRYIYITSKIEDEQVKIHIIDSGSGASEDVVDRLFEPYFTTKDKTSGTGIGLFMVHDIIVKHMGGKISVKNDKFFLKDKQYKGLKFTIELPIDKRVLVDNYVI